MQECSNVGMYECRNEITESTERTESTESTESIESTEIPESIDSTDILIRHFNKTF